MKATWTLLWIGLFAGLLGSAATAWGQVTYDHPPEVEYQVPWAAIGYAAVFVVGTAAVGFKNARRTHLD